ncbi:glycosyltransferase family 2 protein [Nocardioides ferulae]|uniref:glycosyltransferase family 2 protein n=1 Tax=Nocardioides ferulae TaxID=2340821 RepID=UPI000EAC0B9A|nr:glycosyltransferase [Nocardioides ferulae]
MALLRRRRAPLLSVVVPVYNVAGYLDDCLASVLGQSHGELDVVVVDDGSTDASGEIAERWAARDARVRVLHQANAGLGAARNAGTAQARGSHLAFADSDDLVPDGAYATMLAALERTGSAFAVGAVERFTGEQRSMTPLVRENHREDRFATRLEDMPLLLADVFAWNKVFRRDFWDDAGLEFPVGVRYEDQPALTRALLAADRVDVLAQTVYLWRVREDGTSISQQRASVADLADRVLTKRWSTEQVRQRASSDIRQVWFSRVLPVDMWEYFRAAPTASEEYWDALRAALTEFWNSDTVPFERTSLPLRQRLMGWLVQADRRADLGSLLAWLDQHPGPLPRRTVAGRELVAHPFADDPDLPPELLVP